MAKITSPAKAVDELYSRGRIFPYGQPILSAATARTGQPKYVGGDRLELDPKLNSPAVQCPEDRQAPGYDNNHPNDWVRGAHEDACAMPHFDHSKRRRK